MSFCPKCGTKLPDGLKFCTSCGASIDGSIPSKPAQPSYVSAPQAPVQSLASEDFISKYSIFAIIAGILFLLGGARSTFTMLSNAFSLNFIYLCILTNSLILIAAGILLLLKFDKKRIVAILILAAGILILVYNLYYLTGSKKTSLIMIRLSGILDALGYVLLGVFMLASKKGKKSVNKVWYVPAILAFLGTVIYTYFNNYFAGAAAHLHPLTVLNNTLPDLIKDASVLVAGLWNTAKDPYDVM